MEQVGENQAVVEISASTLVVCWSSLELMVLDTLSVPLRRSGWSVGCGCCDFFQIRLFQVIRLCELRVVLLLEVLLLWWRPVITLVFYCSGELRSAISSNVPSLVADGTPRWFTSR